MKTISRAQKIIAAILLIIIVLIVVYIVLAYMSYNPDNKTIFGVTFSKKFAQEMKLDWQQAYLATLDELKVKYIRIPTYWEDIEPQQDSYYFNDIDWQLNEAQKRDVKVIVVVGRRQPRWPECHEPDWVNELTYVDARARARKNIRVVIDRYKDHPAIEMWQVENEPFLDFFGECPKMSKTELKEEIDIVRTLDDRPILITDSGELSIWYPAIKMGDYFGHTLYRVTWNKYIGYWRYFFVPPSYYRVKAYVWGKPLETIFVAELQAEPWFPGEPLKTPLEDHFRTMDTEQLKANAEYAKKVGLARAYFWGVEWWYWLKQVQGEPEIWETAKEYFK
jgi:cellulase (glycosyl hydrolase family 5)